MVTSLRLGLQILVGENVPYMDVRFKVRDDVFI
jgi:hypothetical protein